MSLGLAKWLPGWLPTLSRRYPGTYRVLVVWDDEVDGTPTYAFTEPAEPYEECEKLLILVGLGVPFEGHRITRAMIVGPQAGSVE